MKYKRYIGILLGAIYGITYRVLCEQDILPQSDFFDFNIYSVSFIWVLPVVISVIPIFIAQEEILESTWRKVTYPIYSVLLFFMREHVRTDECGGGGGCSLLLGSEC